MSKSHDDEVYEKGVRDGLEGDFLDDFSMDSSNMIPGGGRNWEIYEKGYDYGVEHRQDHTNGKHKNQNSRSYKPSSNEDDSSADGLKNWALLFAAFIAFIGWLYYWLYYKILYCKILLPIFRATRRSIAGRKARSKSRSGSKPELRSKSRSRLQSESHSKLHSQSSSRPQYKSRSRSRSESQSRPRSESRPKPRSKPRSSANEQNFFIIKSAVFGMVIGGLIGGFGLSIGKTIVTITGVENLFAGFALGAMIGWTIGAILGAMVGSIVVAIRR